MGSENSNRRILAIACILFLGTFALFSPALRHGFVEFDDNFYVTENLRIQAGLSWDNLVWAFTTPHAGFWQPLTLVSHMLDCQLYGTNPAGHHLSAILIHAASSVLLFLALVRMTRSTLRCAAVAAIWAWHPLRVESVVWIGERKDVLGVFFWMLTLWNYTRYAAAPEPARYGAVLASFGCGLMCKPMLVTLPFVLLLLDYWPLRRLSFPFSGGGGGGEGRGLPARCVLLEKIPLLALALLASAVAFLVMAKWGSVARLDQISLSARVANALVAYATYLGMMLWPANLAVFYPHPGSWAVGRIMASTLVVGLLTAFSIRKARTQPWCLVGWLWYLGTLVPVIGLVQLGSHAMADRYTYIPMVGVLLAGVWALGEIAVRLNLARPGMIAATLLVLTACVLTTLGQLSYWHNTVTLFDRALSVTSRNSVIHANLGFHLARRGDFPGAVRHFDEALKFDPKYPEANVGLGYVFLKTGRASDAVPRFETAIKERPNYPEALNNLGLAQTELGRLDAAVAAFERSLTLAPDSLETHNNFAMALMRQRRPDLALAHYQAALRLKPDMPDILNNMGGSLLMLGRVGDARACIEEAIRLAPDNMGARNNYGLALAAGGDHVRAAEQFSLVLRQTPNDVPVRFQLALALSRSKPGEALTQLREVLRVRPDWPPALNALAWRLATLPDDSLRNGTEAVSLAQMACSLGGSGQPAYLATLAAAQAETGRWDEALVNAREAARISEANKDSALAEKLAGYIRAIEAHRPIRE